jgi:hypothetical protein
MNIRRPKFLMDPRRPISLKRVLMDRADVCCESRIGARPGGKRPPRIVAAGGDSQYPAHRGNSVAGLIRVHELERRDGTEPVSVAR